MLPLAIDSIAISLGFLEIHWYGIILASGAIAGLLLAIQEGKRFKIPADFFMDLLLIGGPTAIVFARIYYVAFKWDYYSEHPEEIIAIWNGGIAIYGALIGAIVAAVWFVRKRGYNFWRIADICAPSLIIGQAIGRWGNFMNQEAYGGPTEESFLRSTLHLPDWIVNQMFIADDVYVEGIYRHPTFLYESLWNFAGLALLFYLRRRPWVRAGEIFMGYFIWYSIGRFFIEALRTDSLAFQGPDWLASLMNGLWSPMDLVFTQGALDPAYGNVRISQLLAVLIVLAASVFIVWRRKTGRADVRYSDPVLATPYGSTNVDMSGSDNLTVEERTSLVETMDDVDVSTSPVEAEEQKK